MDGGSGHGAGGSKDGGSSDPRKRKSDKKKDDKPKERKRGHGVAMLEIMMRLQSEMAELNKQNSRVNQGPSNQIPDGTTDGMDIAAIRASSYPWSMHATVGPSIPYYPPNPVMAYGCGNAVRGASSGQLLSTPFRPLGASGAVYYPYSNYTMLAPNEVTMTQPLSEEEHAIDFTREEEGHNTSVVESTNKNSDDPEDPDGPDLQLKL
ncbi:protein SPEAR3-like [Oryza brachyantha]|uniref:Uncharacterized protein n=1 Tax=Oryza brachyantha TaxID=4533 RepID=J3M9N2_ORYBR|nr:protein SPEAR3-like [Oryza brachyantha]